MPEPQTVAGLLHISDLVVTEDCLRRQHRDEAEIVIPTRSVVTPTGWDYIRNHRLRVRRGDVAGAPPAASGSGSAPPAPPSTAIPEVLPAAADGASIRQLGRFDHPDRPFGCKNDDFGSGFADSSLRQGDTVRAPQTARAGGGDPQFEALVQQITDEIMERLNER